VRHHINCPLRIGDIGRCRPDAGADREPTRGTPALRELHKGLCPNRTRKQPSPPAWRPRATVRKILETELELSLVGFHNPIPEGICPCQTDLTIPHCLDHFEGARTVVIQTVISPAACTPAWRAALLWARVGRGGSREADRFPASKLVLRPKVQSSFIHRICPRNDRNQEGSTGYPYAVFPLRRSSIRINEAVAGTRVR